jgi:enoyl-CoA hydratase/carnithine racemase
MHDLEFMRVETPEDGIALVTLDRPDRLNALSWPMIDEFLELMDALGADDDLRAIVLTGAGRGFCAGLDIKQRDDALGGDDDVLTVYRRQEKIGRLAIALRRNPHPVIAAVNGPAAGGGFAIALAADVRLAAPEAAFHASFVRIGLSSGDAGVSYLLPRLIGLGRASELMLTGGTVDAAEAERIGLVNRVVEADKLVAAAVELAKRIAANSPFGVWMTKQVLEHNVDAPGLQAAVELENRTQTLATRTADMHEALAAFREKRAPTFTGT